MFYIFYVSQLYLFLKMSFRKRFKYEVDAMNASTLRGFFGSNLFGVFHGPPVKVLVYRDMGDFCIF